ncbi:hypothetical protein A3D09_02585 [Candidatus Collierbacteria bacterium RIFCSPHIGHO2_02_FULL_49_10]|uniref:Uncharacterized protein n=1 Tax=Candidatus Collierbacteria bacterium RIFCSPHIGHO2_02_FULL_49_10 TaxID=1817723 RepID=A0A1F5EVR4_9BACT|nr:MAG: hypothetical protein A3D09_02585 [Candidatus Collierbacteria bacterium RIFCSPHIGHO2_02_FULL_49_10]
MFATKVKAFLLHLYPELLRFPIFAKFSSTIVFNLTPRVKKVMRWGLPIATVLLVPIIGLKIGVFLLGLFRPATTIPTPIEVTSPTPTSTYQSTFLPLKRSVQDFNPALPDPLPPVFDEKISLEPITE